jgi:hypothetical protein
MEKSTFETRPDWQGRIGVKAENVLLASYLIDAVKGKEISILFFGYNTLSYHNNKLFL